MNIPVTTAEKLSLPGANVKLHTLVIYREDAQTLYGFTTPAERDFFRLMIENVTGVGPKGALGIMGRLSLASLEGAIRAGDIAALAKVPGIGKKTAERLVVELRAKVGASDGSATNLTGESAPAPSGASTHRDAVAALAVTGACLSAGASAEPRTWTAWQCDTAPGSAVTLARGRRVS